MKINLGYACATKTLDITCSSIITYTEYCKKNDIDKVHAIIKKNLDALKKILIYNHKNNINFFRLSSKLIPLATKDEVVFEYLKTYEKDFNELKELCKNIRIDVHPDQFTVLNSVKKEVIENSIKNLEYHYNILNALGIKKKLMILHVGSSVFGKEKSIKRFINNFKKLPKHLQNSIAIENDDKVYNIKDCLYLSNKLKIPFVLDYHHYICNNDGEDINDYFIEIFDTWKNINPKIHFSSPKGKLKKDFRSHHDYIDAKKFIIFLEQIKNLPYNIDIMIEAKAKDEAVFKLIRELKYLTNLKIDDTTIWL